MLKNHHFAFSEDWSNRLLRRPWDLEAQFVYFLLLGLQDRHRDRPLEVPPELNIVNLYTYIPNVILHVGSGQGRMDVAVSPTFVGI